MMQHQMLSPVDEETEAAVVIHLGLQDDVDADKPDPEQQGVASWLCAPDDEDHDSKANH